jgi:hypothetical protein
VLNLVALGVDMSRFEALCNEIWLSALDYPGPGYFVLPCTKIRFHTTLSTYSIMLHQTWFLHGQGNVTVDYLMDLGWAGMACGLGIFVLRAQLDNC